MHAMHSGCKSSSYDNVHLSAQCMVHSALHYAYLHNIQGVFLVYNVFYIAYAMTPGPPPLICLYTNSSEEIKWHTSNRFGIIFGTDIRIIIFPLISKIIKYDFIDSANVNATDFNQHSGKVEKSLAHDGDYDLINIIWNFQRWFKEIMYSTYVHPWK